MVVMEHRSPADPDRTIGFEATFNFRDLGGYVGAGGATVAWRRLFRADGLHRLSESDGDQLRALGMTTVIDLRTQGELDERGRFPADLAPVDYHHLPLFDVIPDWNALPDLGSPTFLSSRYAEMLEQGRTTLASVLGILAREESYPAVFHCAVGKDRTGIVAAIVLGLLGVDDDTIVADYALSHLAMVRFQAWLVDRHPETAAQIAANPQAISEALPHTMVQFLADLRERFGTYAGLAADLGVDQATIDGLRACLLV
jgi:protein-tyrosine phosphatase